MPRTRFDAAFQFDRAINSQIRHRGVLAEKKRNTVKRTVRSDKLGKVREPITWKLLP
jgi:hypothetical protein